MKSGYVAMFLISVKLICVDGAKNSTAIFHDLPLRKVIEYTLDFCFYVFCITGTLYKHVKTLF